MDINELLKGLHCTCGKHHRCDIQHVVIERDAISSLRELTGDYHSILIVADENTFSAAGDKTLTAIAGRHSRSIIFPGNPILKRMSS